MSRATIEQALIGLIPTLNGPLPLDLVELSVSLLARSRSVAHALKSDEEIARPYACAQLACERLKKRLNLPSINSRPPCPPRIYKKLYKYLESALLAPNAASEGPQTPRKASTSAATSARTTPKTPLSTTKTPRSIRRDDGNAYEAPEWIMPTIRSLLVKFSYPFAAPHVYTGVESILPLLARMSTAAAETPSKRPRRAAAAPVVSVSNVSELKTLGLIAVVLFYVLSRMMDQDISPAQYVEWREKATSALVRSATGKNFNEPDVEAEIEQLMPMAQEEGWLQMEWFMNVTSPVQGEAMEGIEMAGETNIINRRKQSGPKNRSSAYIGLGTMMQDAVDYLGTCQREDYVEWKASTMARISEIEASQSVA